MLRTQLDSSLAIISFIAFYLLFICVSTEMIKMVMKSDTTQTLDSDKTLTGGKPNTTDPFIGLPNNRISIMSYCSTFLIGIGNCKICANPDQEDNIGNLIIMFMCILRALLILGFPIYALSRVLSMTGQQATESWGNAIMNNIKNTPEMFLRKAMNTLESAKPYLEYASQHSLITR